MTLDVHSVVHANNASVWIPTESEWYKAAYYQPAAAGGLLCRLAVVVCLQIQPHFSGPCEIAGKAQGGVCGDGAIALHDLIDAARGHADVPREAVFRKTERQKKILAQNFTGMNGGVLFHGAWRSMDSVIVTGAADGGRREVRGWGGRSVVASLMTFGWRWLETYRPRAPGGRSILAVAIQMKICYV